ncbi:STAS-like domain-containing protein [Aeromicrobium fastidiosum]|uniref:MerR family DNA-binding transcriptional regulator n=1 Tax=Aeromicrobium fastidiosum TaxID=52699 RepID=A0A641AQ58_9ACTN|nr:DUF4325 domain-containing protein [Aeromicrobium fastidiosum]KAA1380069.1 MerR family DNA-binding transcriptional regulator [Aeromicrobium fastidiosum]MBP2389595.1 excisionase family DNA binding protein [Aeromicrobium fastidiosum]
MAHSPTNVSIAVVARRLGVSVSQVRALADAGVLPSSRTTGGHRRFDLDAALDAWARHYGRRPPAAHSVAHRPDATGIVVVDRADPLDGLEESQVWREIAGDLHIDDRPLARAVSRYAFTEMLNNAIDHSSGSTARVKGWSDGDQLMLEIADDGVGIFDHLALAKGLPDSFAAIAELTKGRQTTAPEAHTGEGIFFTSKAVRSFTLEANGISWIVDNDRDDHAVGLSPVTTGTSVRLVIHRATTLDLGSLFRDYSDDHEFTRTSPVIKLFGIGVDFVSRSEAKRLLAGLERFTEVELDFAGVVSVGQGFVDEVFRVWPQSNPGTALTPTHMNDAVAFMVTRGLPRAPRGA